MGKSKAQGTKWESALVKRAKAYGIPAGRLAEGGKNDKGDVLIGWDHPPSAAQGRYIVAVAWKRLVQSGGPRRQPDGAPEVAVITVNDLLYLLLRARVDAYVECKATERLNVTRTLAKARAKALR